MDYIRALQAQGSKASSGFRWLLFLGIFNVVLGLFAVAFTGVSTLLSVLYLGWLLILSGVATLYFAFQVKKIGGHWSPFIFGILAVLCGVLMLLHPVADAVVLTLLIAVFIFASGVVSLVSCFFAPFVHRGWVFFGSLVSIACGLVIYFQWPGSGAWVLGTFFGIYLIFHGATQIQIAALGGRWMKASGRPKPKRR